MQSLPISVGKVRRLQSCATPRGALAVLALDQRSALRPMLNAAAPETVTHADIVAFKQDVTRALTPVATAILLDPQFGAAQAIASGALPGTCGLLVSAEKSGYEGDATARVSKQAWPAARVQRMGANAVKLLVYFHPESSMAAPMERLVADVAADCAALDMPLFLEILTYSINPNEKKLSPAERRRVVVESARRLVRPGVDVLKVEFPLDSAVEADEREWAAACAALSAACAAPWVLLSAGVDFELFLRQVRVACENGASGVTVGRAIWKEATNFGSNGVQRVQWLNSVARERMARVVALCDALAKPWQHFFALPQIGEDWHAHYV
jgi:tagatose 1,6-diphosphate aldolase